jgi:DnaJ-domain-containing protein 1
VDRFFDRLGDFLRLVMGADSASGRVLDPRDPDVRAALSELDEYLDSGGGSRRWEPSGADDGGRTSENRSGPGGETGGARQGTRHTTGQQAPEALRKDYANLEVPFSAPLEEVRTSYRRLVRRYHPDRFSADPEKLKLATEITMRLNASFQHIEGYERARH